MSEHNEERVSGITSISASGVRIFRTRVMLGDLTRQPAFRGALMVSRRIGPLPVYSEDGIRLGHARIEKVAGQLIADIEIDYHCEERLLAETGAERLWAWLVGNLTFRKPLLYGLTSNGSAGIDFTRDIEAASIEVEEIVISRKAPADPTVARFGGAQ